MKALKMIVLAMIIAALCGLTVTTSQASSDNSVDFSLDTLPDDMTLTEALQSYPEIFRLFPFEYVSNEAAERGIQNGISVIDGTDINAKDFLSYINYRKKR